MFAFFVLSTSPGVDIKQFGIGLAAGIIFDATVIRALLVPSLMRLLGTLELVAAAVRGARAVRPRRRPGDAGDRAGVIVAQLSVSVDGYLAGPSPTQATRD